MPLVSIVIPTFNAAPTLQTSIESALRQSHADIEVIVCDDASVDDTVELVKTIDDRRLRYLVNSTNSGEGASRDRAIDAAKGEWIAVLDADDAWHPQRLEKLLSAVPARNDTMIFDNILLCHNASSGLQPWRALRGPKAFGMSSREPVDVDSSRWAAARHFLIKPMIPAAALRNSGVRHSDKRFSADTEFFLRLVAAGMRLRYVPVAYYFYRITPGSMTAITPRAKLMCNMLQEVMPLFTDSPTIQAALRHKIRYRDFTMALKSRRFSEAAKLGIRDPRLLGELVMRGLSESTYPIHRMLRGGDRRRMHRGA